MLLNEYQERATRTAVYPQQEGLVYTALSLAEEAGEFSGKVGKWIRKGGFFDKQAAAQELGDVLWVLSQAARELGYKLDEIAEMNLNKLEDRAQRGVLVGSGDTR